MLRSYCSRSKSESDLVNSKKQKPTDSCVFLHVPDGLYVMLDLHRAPQSQCYSEYTQTSVWIPLSRMLNTELHTFYYKKRPLALKEKIFNWVRLNICDKNLLFPEVWLFLQLVLLKPRGERQKFKLLIWVTQKRMLEVTLAFQFEFCTCLTSSRRGNYVCRSWNWRGDCSPSATWWYFCQHPVTEPPNMRHCLENAL